jgi:EamA domain-containing membrane protein RarD
MRLTFIILSIIAAILGLALSILPFGSIAVIPIAVAFIFGLLAFRSSNNAGKSTTLVKLVFSIVIISLGLTIYNSLRPNEVNEENESTLNENRLDEESIEELESIEIEE